MSFELGTFTGRFHHIPESADFPKGRILTIWENETGGTFYRDGTDIVGFLQQARDTGNKSDTDFWHDLYKKLKAEERRRHAPPLI